MTTQKAYERIREYFSRPGAVLAQSNDGFCFYRVGLDAKSPQRCAIGCLIPDSRYRKKFDDPDGGMDGTDVIEAIPSLKGVNVSFLLSAQGNHDGAANVKQFLLSLDSIAECYGLTPVAA